MKIRRKKFGVVLWLIPVLAAVKIFLWLEPGSMGKRIAEDISQKAETFVVYVMQNSNMKLAYAMKDESGVIERVVKNANSNTSSVYSFVENNDSKNCTFVVTITGLSQFSAASCIGFNSSDDS